MPKPGPDEGGVPGVFSLIIVILIIVVVYGGLTLVTTPFIEKMLQQ